MKRRILLLITVVLSALSGWTQNKTFTTQLPIVYLNTYGQTIPDEPKINARLEIAWKGEGASNSTSDPHDHFSGQIAIEVRGSSSQMFPKKSYGLELRDDAGQDMDFPLLGLPEEEDWILYAPYTDKSLLRNVLTFTLAGQMSETYVPRCRFVELFLNNQYEGIYVLMEKIKRDNNRVDIAKLKAEDISGEDLTGGYIIKIDKQTGDGGEGWNSQYMNVNNMPTYYQYDYPESADMQPVQKTYIQNYVNDFETAIYYLRHDEQTGYQNYMNLETFYDYVILNELSRNVDGYRLSTYLNKDKSGKLNAGPIWDYNLTYGNADYYDGWRTYGLVVNYNMGGDYWQVPFWWKKLVADPVFTDPLRCRWEEIKESVLSEEHILGVMDSLITYLGSAVDRNFGRWPILSEHVWPNYYVGYTYENEINWMKNWISLRLDRVDFELPGTCSISSIPDSANEFSVSFYPNPFQNELNVKVIVSEKSSCRLAVFSMNGMLVSEKELSVSPGENRFNFSFPSLNSGVYFYRLTQGDQELDSGKLVKL